MSGRDYPIFNISTIRKEIASYGTKAWLGKDCGNPKHCLGKSKFLKSKITDFQLANSRIHESAYECGEMNTYRKIRGREIWWWKEGGNHAKMCRTRPLSSGGIFSRESIQFLLYSEIGKAGYAFFRVTSPASVEYYFGSVLCSSPSPKDLKNSIVGDRMSSTMTWNRHGKVGLQNSVLNLEDKDVIELGRKVGTLFAHKFTTLFSKHLLDWIDETGSVKCNFTGK